jgi:hypothetical protein
MNDTIYVVMGSANDGSRDWPVLAFLDEQKAEEFIAKYAKNAGADMYVTHGIAVSGCDGGAE